MKNINKNQVLLDVVGHENGDEGLPEEDLVQRLFLEVHDLDAAEVLLVELVEVLLLGEGDSLVCIWGVEGFIFFLVRQRVDDDGLAVHFCELLLNHLDEGFGVLFLHCGALVHALVHFGHILLGEQLGNARLPVFLIFAVIAVIVAAPHRVDLVELLLLFMGVALLLTFALQLALLLDLRDVLVRVEDLQLVVLTADQTQVVEDQEDVEARVDDHLLVLRYQTLLARLRIALVLVAPQTLVLLLVEAVPLHYDVLLLTPYVVLVDLLHYQDHTVHVQLVQDRQSRLLRRADHHRQDEVHRAAERLQVLSPHYDLLVDE